MSHFDDAPVTWVPPGDSDDDNAAEQGAAAAKDLDEMVDDPLLGPVERTSSEGKQLLAARKQHGVAVDVRYESFNPQLYLATVHQRTPLSQVEQAADRLRAMAEKGGKATRDSKKLIHANFGRFVAAQDKMLELRAAISGPAGPQEILDELTDDLSRLEDVANSAFAPILSLQSESAGVRTALAVLERHHALFQLPSLIKEDGAAGRYDRLVATYARAQEMLVDCSHGVLERLREEVEAQVDAICRSMRRRLSDLAVPVAQLPETALNLSHLEDLMRHSAQASRATKIKSESQGGRSEAEGSAKGPGGGLVASVRQCMTLQQEAVLTLMARTVANFQDLVSQIEISDAGASARRPPPPPARRKRPEMRGEVEGPDSGGEREREESGVGNVTGGLGRGAAQSSYDGMVLSAVSTLSKLLSSNLIRLQLLKTQSVSLLHRHLASTAPLHPPLARESAAADPGANIDAHLLAISLELVRYFQSCLRPIFIAPHEKHKADTAAGLSVVENGEHATAQEDENGAREGGAVRARAGGVVMAPSHLVTMDCLDVICHARTDIAKARGCLPSQTIRSLDAVIEELGVCMCVCVCACVCACVRVPGGT